MSQTTMKNLHHYLLLHGHNTELKKLVIDHHVMDALGDLARLDTSKLESLEPTRISKLRMRASAQRFLHGKFQLHPVGYLSDQMIKDIFDNQTVETAGDLITMYNESAEFMDPFHLPITYDLDDPFQGVLINQGVEFDDDRIMEMILPRLEVYFGGIRMPRKLRSIAPTNYVHEITHSQLESHKGVIDEFYNSEVLSIFLEFVHSYENNPEVFKIDLVKRINNTILNLYSMYHFQIGEEGLDKTYNEYDYHDNSKYLISTLKAFQIFHLYETGNDAMKCHILHGCQKVFDGEQTVEEFLESIGVSLSSAMTSEYAKYFVKKVS